MEKQAQDSSNVYEPFPEVHDVGWALGDGSHINFWNDVWCRDTSIFVALHNPTDISPKLSAIVKDFTYSNLLQVPGNLLQRLPVLCDKLSGFQILEQQDQVIWRPVKDGILIFKIAISHVKSDAVYVSGKKMICLQRFLYLGHSFFGDLCMTE